MSAPMEDLTIKELTPDQVELYRLYRLKRKEDSPTPQEIFPMSMPARLYLGIGGGCSWAGPGFSYRPCEWDLERVTAMESVVHWTAPKIAPEIDGCDRRCEEAKARTALYRLRNSEGDLLYIGISSAPLRRWTEHVADKEWGPEVSQFNIEWLECRCKALAAEAAAIRTEGPIHNVVHNSQRAA